MLDVTPDPSREFGLRSRVQFAFLTIRTATNGTEARLYVVDQGTGIAPEDLRNIFDAFWSTKAGGMGIGLAICQSIVAAHRGKITASNNPQGGATFCVSLPMETRS